MNFKFNIGDTVYGVRNDSVAEYKVLARKYEEDASSVAVTYEVCRPNNTGSSVVLGESRLHSDKEVALNVLLEEENQRHEDRIRQIYAS